MEVTSVEGSTSQHLDSSCQSRFWLLRWRGLSSRKRGHDCVSIRPNCPRLRN